MTRLMNRHVLPDGQTPIRQVEVGFGEGTVLMSGTMVKLGAPVPFSRATLRSNTGAVFDTMAFHLAARPRSRVFDGRNPKTIRKPGHVVR